MTPSMTAVSTAGGTMLKMEEEIEAQNIPLPRDSMVSIQLSDAQSLGYGSLPANDEVRDSYVSTASRRTSIESAVSSQSSTSVDWDELDKTEEQEEKYGGTDNSTALLLARLEQENNAIAKDPKSAVAAVVKAEANPRPPSVHQLRRMVTGPQRQSLRYSQLPPPGMTELEFWAALVQDYRQTAQRLPILTTNKIRGGVPPPLRGVVWPSIAGAHDPLLHEAFDKLSTEPSPYDGLIGKDVGRSFPNVEMFREKDGEGQQQLRRVLKAFSLYDKSIGYCQGLGFVVGPLLMHMSEAEAFSVLVRLMEHYDLRNCYTPDLAGLHLRIYQFQILLSRHLPELSAHLGRLGVEPLYISQWFLSFFAVTCPLPMLLRIYDIILTEGATETLMRVALSLMQRNQKKLLAFAEFEDVMQFLLSRSLWDTYAQHADDMVQDFTSLTSLVTKENLQNLEADFKLSQVAAAPSPLRTAAASLLGRFWTGSAHTPVKSNATLSLSVPVVLATADKSELKKKSSSHSLISNIASNETTSSGASTAATEVSDVARTKSQAVSIISVDTTPSVNMNATDRDLHNQIEDLLTALKKLQQQNIDLAHELQREREAREEERVLARSMLQQLQEQDAEEQAEDESDTKCEMRTLIRSATTTFSSQESRPTSIIMTKHQLRDDAEAWKQRHADEAARCQELMRQLDAREAEQNSLREDVRDARQRVQDAHKDKQRLELQIREMKIRQSTSSPLSPESPDLYTPITEKELDFKMPPPEKNKGLREFRLGRAETVGPRVSSMQFNKRTSSLLNPGTFPLQLQAQLALASISPTTSRDDTPRAVTPPTPTAQTSEQSADSLLIELVLSKTAEAQAKQELEETKAKLESLRKIISGGAVSPGGVQRPVSSGAKDSKRDVSPVPPPVPSKSPAAEVVSKKFEEKKTAHAASGSVGGFFSGWGRKAT